MQTTDHFPIRQAAPAFRRLSPSRFMALLLRMDARYRDAWKLADLPKYRLDDMGISRGAARTGPAKADLPDSVRHGW